MNCDVLFVYLPISFGAGRSYGLPPLGVFYLAAGTRNAGMSARVLDANIAGLTLDQTVQAISVHRPKLVALSILTPHLRALTAVVERLNDAGYKGRIIAGGPHFNDTREETLTFLDIDYAMYGECDKTFVDFAKGFLAGEPVDSTPNLIHRRDGKLVVNPPSKFIEDLDSLPRPDLSQGIFTYYEKINGRRRRAISIMCSRGCPYKCSFCDVPTMWGKKVRERSPQDVVDEIIFNRDNFGIHEVFFRDSVFTLNYKYVAKLMDEFERRSIKDIVWHCNARVDRITRPLLERMKKNGLVCISYGVESGNEVVLEKMLKKVTLKQIEDTFQMTAEVGVESLAFFMVGNPGETRESARETLALAKRLPCSYIEVGPTVAYPGTEIYRTAVAEKLINDPKWYLNEVYKQHSLKGITPHLSPGQLNLPDFSPQEQFDWCRRIIRTFYLRPTTWYRIFVRHFSFQVTRRAIQILPGFLKYCLARESDPGVSSRVETARVSP